MAIVIKNKIQQDGIRRACKVVAEVLSAIGCNIRPGISSSMLQDIAIEVMKKNGAISGCLGCGDKDNPYPGSICVSVNDEVVHGIPNNRPLQDGDIVSADIVAELDGYFGDATRSWPVGEITPDAKMLLDVTEKALAAGIKEARAGNTVRDISRAIFNLARDNGIGVVRDLVGHGVGLQMHEPPQIPNFITRGPTVRLRPGMTIAIEPMFTLGSHHVKVDADGWTIRTEDGSLAAHFENTILITNEEPEILTIL